MKSIALFTAVIRITLITALISSTVIANAQNVAVNTTGSAADASAMLDVSSTSKGFLAPRMTTIQRTGISAPANGLMVFDTDTKTYWYFSTTWKEIGNAGGGGGGFSLPYSGSSTDAGKMFSLTNNAATSGATALYGRASSTGSGTSPIYSMGVWGDNSTGVGVLGTSGNIGVIGQSTDAASGTGVLGSGSNGVYGQSTKENGAGIYGYAGGISSSLSKAAFFTNTNYSNTNPVVEIANYGTGNNNLLIQNTNSSSNSGLLKMKNAGNGAFMQLLDEANDVKAAIYKNGNINTDGNIYAQGDLYVNGLKGIVRSTYSNQMRMELMNVTVPGGFHFVVPSGGFGEVFINTQDITVTFNTPFDQAPAVYRANLSSGDVRLESMGWRIYDVTTTGFKITISPNPSMDFISTNAVFKFVAVGYDD
jgi:hypothetical protein